MRTRIALAAFLAAALAAAAVAQPPPPPGRDRERNWPDIELARIAADIYLLHRINDCNLTPQQTRKVIPVLEGVLGDARRLRESVKGKLTAERKRLILGQPAAARPDDIKRMIEEDAARVRDHARQALENTKSFLSPDQVQKLQGLMIRHPEGLFGRVAAQRRGPGREPGSGPGGGPGMRTPRDPNVLALERIVELLKEKLAASGS